jgi:hypothetical protein
MGIKVFLKDVRISFCQSLHVPEQYQGKGAFRHSSTFLIEPGSENDKKVQAAIKAAATETFEKKAPAMLESLKGNSNKYCYMSGDLKDIDGYQGMMALASHRAAKDGPPGVLDRDKTPLGPTVGRPYAGCYVNASVEIYAQKGENSGIRCGLLGVQFFRDGDSFGGGAKLNIDDFDDLGAPADADDDI